MPPSHIDATAGFSHTDLWLVFLLLASSGGVLLMSCWATRKLRGVSWGRVHREDDGASYSVALVFTLPTFITLMAVLIECNSLMFTRIGIAHASFASARSAQVYGANDLYNALQLAVSDLSEIVSPDQADEQPPVEPGESASAVQISDKKQIWKLNVETLQQRCRLAAAKAMAPFTSGATHHGAKTHPPLVEDYADRVAEATLSTLAETASENGEQRRHYLRQKFLNAYDATRVSLRLYSDSPGEQRGDEHLGVEVTLAFQAPIVVPGVGVLLGEPATDDLGSPRDYRVFPMESRCVLVMESGPWSTFAGRPTSGHLIGVKYE